MSAQQELKPVVKATDMEAEELNLVLELASKGLKLSLKERQEKALCRFLKYELDKTGNGWNCVVGRNFGAHVIHQSKKYAFIQLRELSVLIWKA